MTNTAGKPIKSLATCMYCQLDTAGTHKSNCPARNVNPIVNTSTNTISPMTKEENKGLIRAERELLKAAKDYIAYRSIGNGAKLNCAIENTEKEIESQPKAEPSRTCKRCSDTGWVNGNRCKGIRHFHLTI